MTHQAGVTLLEVVVVCLLMAVTGSAGWTAWRTLGVHQTAETFSRATLQWLSQGRALALQTQTTWQVCAAPARQPCTSDWTGAWQAHSETGQHWTGPSLPNGWHVHWRSFRRQPAILWSPYGDARDSNGTLTLCPPLNQSPGIRQLVISRAGRIRLERPARQGAAALAAALRLCESATQASGGP